MSSPAGIRAGKAFIELFAEDSQLRRTLRGWQTNLSGWAKNVSGIGQAALAAGAAALAPLGAAALSFANQGSRIDDIAQRTGASAEDISSLGYACERTGTSVETLEKALIKQQKVIADAAGGGKASAAALRLLGLSADKLQQMPVADQFREIASALNNVDDPARKTQAALAILGKSGAELIPLSREYQQLEERARKLGIVMSDEDVSAAATLGDAFDDLQASGKGFLNSVGVALAPVLTMVANAVVNATSQVAGWIREHKQAIQIAAAVAAGVAAFGAVLIGVGGTMSLIAAAIGGLLTITSALAAAWAFLAPIAVSAFTVLIGPIGIIISLVAALTTVWMTFTVSGRATAHWIAEAFATTMRVVKTTVGGMASALLKGDLALARDIFWAGMEVAWTRGVGSLKSLWRSFLVSMVSGAEWAVNAVAEPFLSLTGIDLTVGFAKSWDEWAEKADAKQRTKIDQAEKRLAELVGQANAVETDAATATPGGRILMAPEVTAATAGAKASVKGVGFESARSVAGIKQIFELFSPKRDTVAAGIAKLNEISEDQLEQQTRVGDLLESFEQGDV